MFGTFPVINLDFVTDLPKVHFEKNNNNKGIEFYFFDRTKVIVWNVKGLRSWNPKIKGNKDKKEIKENQSL